VSIVQFLAPGFLSELFDSIPDTDLDECRRALAEGRYLDGSFACPAGTFLRELVAGEPSTPDEEDDFDQEEEP